jgi:hypothetical protein
VPAYVGVEVTFVVCSEAVRAGGSVRVDPHEELGIRISGNRNIGVGYGCDGLSGRA